MDRIIVPFEGDGAGAGGLAWGQQQVWAAMVEIGSSLAMGGVVPVTDGRTVADFAEELRYHMSRHAAMRTLLRTADDGTVTQEVFDSGEAVLHVLDAEDDPGAAAAALAAEWRDRVFDYEHEWPLRMAVVRHAGVPTHVVALMAHVAADLGGVQVMMRDLATRATHPATQPLDLWRLQQEPSMRRHTAASMRYWEAHLRAVPARRFAGPVDRGEPRYLRTVWSSPAMHLAAEALSARLGADPAWVLLAAFASGLHRVTGATPLVAQAIIGNRFRPGLADVVSPLTQTGLCVLDVAGVPAEEAVARARTASMSTSKYAYYDPAALLALIDAVEHDRGERLELGCFYNDRRTASRPAGGDPPPDAIRAALPASRVLEEVPMRFFNEQLMVNVDDVRDTIQMTVEADTHRVSRDDLHALLAEMESFVVSTALSPAPA
ncbi:condensation domain-containing protein [Dactylosporangium fulvum]|uniref:Condensation domain-containing protein n=1 Tax=Dactylosporangium fulvum TaxID=53359 RepID=A0ABY5VPA7_9ACTN|nr:condensation domain-containing protein [Dactylosporangium fulvum]UWP79523.1 condensation domain-containing protein [Dactylosporangium fulvum]